jgi:hypothetical protein
MTAVEWLINEIDMQYPKINIRWKFAMIDQAIEMEKQQIIDAHKDGAMFEMDSNRYDEQYYNETYKKDNL